MNKLTQNTQGAKDAPKSKKASVKKDAKQQAMPETKNPEIEVKEKEAEKETTVTPAAGEQAKVEIPAPIQIGKELLDKKLAALDAKLSKDKRDTTKSPFHVAYGYFLARTKAGKTLILEYHEKLKPAKWVLRDEKGEVLGEPTKTMYALHDIAVNQF